MHELAITQSILRIAVEEAERVGASRIDVIKVSIGALTDIVPSSVQFYLDALSPGTLAEGVRLEAATVPIAATCQACAHVFPAPNFELHCPLCGAVGTITQGRELRVESIEVQT